MRLLSAGSGWLVLLLFGVGFSYGQEPEFVIERQSYVSMLEIGDLHNRQVVVDLGELEPGKKGLLKWTIINDGPTTLPLRELVVSCQCIRAKILGREIPSQQSVVCEVEIEVPLTSGKSENTFGMELRSAGDTVIRAQIRFRYRGLVSFEKEAVYVQVPNEQEQVEFSIPIVTTPPVIPEKLQILLGRGLSSLTCRCEGDMLHCKVPVSSIPEFGLVGEIEIADPETQVHDSIQCMINRKTPVTFAPRLVRFVPREANRWEAVTLVSVERSEFLMQDQEGKVPTEHVRFSALFPQDGWDLSVEHEAVSDTVYRLRLKASREEGAVANDFPKSTDWELVTLKANHRFQIACQFIR